MQRIHRSSSALPWQIQWRPNQYDSKFKTAKFAFLARSSATSSCLNSSFAHYSPFHSLRLTRYTYIRGARHCNMMVLGTGLWAELYEHVQCVMRPTKPFRIKSNKEVTLIIIVNEI